mmetsp:Transcript_1041/g.1471  ORF Transcript_1041/g.1471 Transcript_1041/m.1471 type:complete len:145 (-) Transcript_1041:301-735(-)
MQKRSREGSGGGYTSDGKNNTRPRHAMLNRLQCSRVSWSFSESSKVMDFAELVEGMESKASSVKDSCCSEGSSRRSSGKRKVGMSDMEIKDGGAKRKKLTPEKTKSSHPLISGESQNMISQTPIESTKVTVTPPVFMEPSRPSS